MSARPTRTCSCSCCATRSPRSRAGACASCSCRPPPTWPRLRATLRLACRRVRGATRPCPRSRDCAARARADSGCLASHHFDGKHRAPAGLRSWYPLTAQQPGAAPAGLQTGLRRPAGPRRRRRWRGGRAGDPGPHVPGARPVPGGRAGGDRLRHRARLQARRPRGRASVQLRGPQRVQAGLRAACCVPPAGRTAEVAVRLHVAEQALSPPHRFAAADTPARLVSRTWGCVRQVRA